ncbi:MULTISPECIES: helix-turn-helix domain-containing protein [unclassified Chryseobacterium]|uniref:AraC family transcriptional regulator n=1 Tax=unclassified Chryseobacterium TaxID=2593645 RepID=UPI0022699A31|nr:MULTISPECIES: helix-turn-helix domain-containing protein [unclassified Chryseobacterium]
MHIEFEPPKELRDTITCFWYNDTDFGNEQTNFEVIPDGFVEVIFYFGEELQILQNGNLQSLPSPFLVGLLNHPAHFYTRKRLQILAIRCFPWTVFDLLNLDSNKNGVDTFEHAIAKLQPSLQNFINKNQIQKAIDLIKAYFLNLEMSTDSLIYKAGIAMRKANGSIPVSKIADSAHTTIRTLERKFKQSSGYTVKDVSGLIRFEKARNILWSQPDSNLAELAIELGYTDQAHLNREFKKYSGTTPGAFARKAKIEKIPNREFVVFIQS